jgi:hypothetical protein
MCYSDDMALSGELMKSLITIFMLILISIAFCDEVEFKDKKIGSSLENTKNCYAYDSKLGDTICEEKTSIAKAQATAQYIYKNKILNSIRVNFAKSDAQYKIVLKSLIKKYGKSETSPKVNKYNKINFWAFTNGSTIILVMTKKENMASVVYSSPGATDVFSKALKETSKDPTDDI